jgi:hypothetical protein
MGLIRQLNTIRINMFLDRSLVAGSRSTIDVIDSSFNRYPSQTRWLSISVFPKEMIQVLTSVRGKLLIISGGGGILLSVFAFSKCFSNSFNFSSPISAFLLAIRSFSSPSILADRAADGFPITVKHGAETKYLNLSTAHGG